MTFHWPLAFWLLLIPFAFLLRDLLRGRRQAAALHPKITQAEAGHRSLVLRTAASRRLQPARLRVCLYLGLVLATAALARPQWGRLEEPVYDQAREIIIALDLSRSMLSQDVKPSRLERARLLITSLLERLEGERTGLVVFSGTAFVQSPLSSDYEILREFLPLLGPDYLPEGGTNYDALIETSIAAFGTSGAADRFLIILSDGEAQTDDWHKHVGELKAKGIRVLGLGIGTSEGAMIPDGAGAFVKDERGAVVLSKLNSSTLHELAAATNGTYVDASSWVDLAQLIQTTVDQGRRGEFKETSRIRLAERFQWALAPALVLLLVSFWREVPVHPKARALKLASETNGPKTQQKPGAAVIAALTMLGGFLAALHSPALHAAEPAAPAADPLSAPVTQLVGQLAARDHLTARDYADLAGTTVAYGKRSEGTPQPAPESVVRDALAALAAGQSLDPKAADWPALRTQLESLLPKKNPPPPKQDKKQSDQNQPDKKNPPPSDQKKPDAKGGDKNDDAKSGDKDKKDPASSPSKSDGDQSKEEAKNANAGQDKDHASSPTPSAQKPENSGPPKPSQSAFGDMKKDDKPPQTPAQPSPQEAPAPPSPGEMQQVGGVGSQTNADPARENPALAIPLQKLDQIRQDDSPARLFQLLQDPSTQPPAPKGKNW